MVGIVAKATYEIRGARPDRRVIERIANRVQPFTLHLLAYFHQLVFAQGRIGVENTFVLLEEGATEFTNIAGADPGAIQHR